MSDQYETERDRDTRLHRLDWLQHLARDRVAGRRTISRGGVGAGHNVEILADQIATHLPELVSVETEEAAHDLRAQLFERNIDLPRIVVGEPGLIEVATHPQADCVVSATVGAVGFVPTLRALEAGKRVALANKETLVMAGELMTRAARASGAELLPVDSEHNALHQCLRGEKRPKCAG